MQSYFQYRRIRALARLSSTSLGQASNSEESWRRASQENGLQRATSHSNDASTAQTPEKKAAQEQIIVTFDGPDDPLNPQNWPLWKKIATNAMTAAVAFIAGFGSSIDAPVIPQAAREFHVSEETESLATVLFLVGFGAGAPFAGPLSETFGRNPIYLGTLLVFCCWILGSALSPNFGAQLAFRFLAGFFGSTAFTTAGGTLGDVFDHQQRGKIFPWFGAVALFGPMIGPVVGGYVGESGLDWRWVEWITLCIAGGIFITMLLFLPETYAPVILGWKAKAMREATGNIQYKGPLDGVQSTSLPRKIGEALYRPISILLTEPIISVLTAYLTFVYMVSFSFFSGAMYIFTASYDFRQGAAYLMFLGVVVGLWLCALASPFYGMLIGREYQKAAAKGKDHPGPEAMLWWAMIGAPLLPVSLFWLAWSDFSSFSFWSPIVACAVFGYSLLSLFLSIYMYIIQAFTKYAASALVAITLVRYVVAGGMVIVSIPMYENLGVHHAPTVLAGIATAFLPVPYLLYFFGERIRAASKRIGTVSQA